MDNNPFLKDLAIQCMDEYNDRLDQLTLVFPNRRAGLFFGQYLSELLERPAWLPQIITLEELMTQMSEFELVDDIKATFMLYAAYRHIVKQPESFDKFYYWGQMIFQDFNDVDNYLVDPEHIFQVITTQKELDESFFYLSEEDQKIIKSFWSGFVPKASKNQHSFLTTWKILNPLYHKFRSDLNGLGVAYKGMIYRNVVELQEEALADLLPKQVWFAGFNALNRAEEALIKKCLELCECKVFWDADDHYLDNPDQESGHFLRGYKSDSVLGGTFSESAQKRLNDDTRKITVTAVALEEGQVKTLAGELAKLREGSALQLQRTAVVLPDELLLTPLLNSIPAEIQKINVTMGLPLRASPYFGLFELLIRLHTRVRSSANDQQFWYGPEVLTVLNQPVIQRYFTSEASRLKTYISEHNRVYISGEEISNEADTLAGFFQFKPDVKGLLSHFLELSEGFVSEQITSVDRATIYELQLVFKRLLQEVREYNLNINLDAFARIWRQMGMSVRVPFTGEPLAGLQIMGVLETRNLDFDRVFVLSMNEGKWPNSSTTSSFIPFNIRKVFDLPVVEHQDALQAYLFYRLLHRAKEMHVFYNNVSEFNHNGELSRFVKQVEFETDIQVQHRTLVNPVGSGSRNTITVDKDALIMEKLRKYVVTSAGDHSRLSPSALNTYLDCRLKFYFSQVESLSEETGLSEDLDPALFGNLLHMAMEHLYTTYLQDRSNNSLEKEDFSNLKGLVESSIEAAFLEYKLDVDMPDGQTIIAKRVIQKYVEAILRHDEIHAPFEIVGLEAGQRDGFYIDLPITIENTMEKVGLKGIIDRIDRKDNTIRVLDYKSGRDQRKFSSLEGLFDRDNRDRNKAVMQVLYYSLLYQRRFEGQSETIVPGLYNSRDLFMKGFDTKISLGRKQIGDFGELREAFEEHLTALVQEIFDVQTPFDQTDDEKKCGYCPYNKICMRG